MSKKRLGRGLNVLIQGDDADTGSIQEIPVNKIEPSPFQPRNDFNEETLQELKASIKEHGVIQPVLVRKKGDGYQLIAGERRWRACRAAEIKLIPAIIQELDDRKAMEIALVENLQREDLNILEEARAYKRLLDEFDLTQDELASRVGKSRSSITNILRLLKLPAAVQEFVSRGTLTMGHARALLALKNPQDQLALARKISQEDLSVREVENLVRAIKEGENDQEMRATEDKEKPDKKPAFFQQAERIMQKSLGTKVVIRPGKKTHTISIKFSSQEELDRILARIQS